MEELRSIPVYEVCLQSGEKSGYALVSADSRSAGVLATWRPG